MVYFKFISYFGRICSKGNKHAEASKRFQRQGIAPQLSSVPLTHVLVSETSRPADDFGIFGRVWIVLFLIAKGLLKDPEQPST